MTQDKHKNLIVMAVLAVTILAVYWRVHEFEFINYDDNVYVNSNEHIRSGLTAENISWVFTSAHGGNWHPLTGLSHLLDCTFFGLNAGRHHLVNLLLHIAILTAAVSRFEPHDCMHSGKVLLSRLCLHFIRFTSNPLHGFQNERTF